MLGDTMSVTNMTCASQHGHGVNLGPYSIIFCVMFIRYNRIAALVHLISDREARTTCLDRQLKLRAHGLL